jgi:hypothetical protein
MKNGPLTPHPNPFPPGEREDNLRNIKEILPLEEERR